MKLIYYLVLSFFLIFPANSDQLYEIIKIPNLKLYKIEDNGLRFLFSEKGFSAGVGISNVSCSAIDENKIKENYNQISESLNVYENDFLNKIRLKYVVICENLKISEIPALGYANPKMKTLMFNINTENKYIDRVLHHEVFHFIHFDEEDIFDQVVWKQLNDLDFGYKECSTCSNKISLKYIDNNKGFLTDYSMSTPYEDMAEVYSFMKTNKKILIERSKKDEIIKKKITFLEKQISKLDINFKY